MESSRSPVSPAGRTSARGSVRALVESAVMVALATALSVIVFYRMPQGGSVTPVSMLPLLILALRWGPGVGVAAGVVYGFIQFLIDPYVLHWAQVLLDYPVAFGLLGLAGFFRRWPFTGVVVGIAGRLGSHFASGVIFFASSAPPGTKVWIYSLAYNSSYLVPEMILTLAALALLNEGVRGKMLKGVE